MRKCALEFRNLYTFQATLNAMPRTFVCQDCRLSSARCQREERERERKGFYSQPNTGIAKAISEQVASDASKHKRTESFRVGRPFSYVPVLCSLLRDRIDKECSLYGLRCSGRPASSTMRNNIIQFASLNRTAQIRTISGPGSERIGMTACSQNGLVQRNRPQRNRPSGKSILYTRI